MLRFLADDRLSNGLLARRHWLQLSSLGAASLFGGQRSISAASSTTNGPGFGKAKSVILIYASGGQSQLETWDPKPEAPEEIRGEFRAIPTAVPGMYFGEHLPKLAKLADRYTILRSVSHDDLDHGSATYLALTGRPHPKKSSNPPATRNDYPTYGSILKRVRPVKDFVQTAVHINGPALVPEIVAPGQFGGFLGPEYDPMLLGDVTTTESVVPDLSPRRDLPEIRLQARRTLLQSIDAHQRLWERDPSALDMNVQYRKAFEMLATPHCREAFNLATESAALRDRYGRHRSGQACLLARKLVEAGVPLITVIWNHTNRGQDRDPTQTDLYGWDTHNDIFEALKVRLLPRFDATMAALLEDLEDRGLLDETLVVCMGEFGRAPRVALEARFAGSSPGRKHWASVYSILLAGAGIGRGKVFGASDSIGGYPKSDRVGPWDVAATMFWALGIDPATHYMDTVNRPSAVTIGKPILGLY